MKTNQSESGVDAQISKIAKELRLIRIILTGFAALALIVVSGLIHPFLPGILLVAGMLVGLTWIVADVISRRSRRRLSEAEAFTRLSGQSVRS